MKKVKISKTTKTIQTSPVEFDEKKKTDVVKGFEIGQSGTQIYAGVIYEEYNPKLRDVQGIAIYDEMRKSDGTVKAVVLSTMLPILRARWFIQPCDDSPQAEEIKTFVEKALFELTDMTWASILRHALLSLPFGVMVMEKVFDSAIVDGKERIIWKKLAPRMPRSIQQWQMSNRQPGIVQRTQNGPLVDIPMEKLLVFVHEKEGDNWWGNAILRPAYKHWHMKNTLYKIDAIAAERQGLGVPYAKMPSGVTLDDQSKVEEIMKNMRANDQAFVIIPEGYEVGFLDMNARTTRDLTPSINHHNREIVKAVLAHFIELGSTDSGSRALSTDQSELFLQSLESVANSIADVFNQSAIRELVDLNFNGVTDYPYLTYAGITRTDVKAMADTYSSLITSKGVNNDPADEQFFRNLLGLPERTEEVAEPNDAVGNVNVEDSIAEVGLSEYLSDIKKKSFPERKDISTAISASIKDMDLGHKMAFLKRTIGTFSQFSSKHELHSLFSTIKGELNLQLVSVRKLAFNDNNTFKSFRALTFAEKKVDFSGIEKNLDKLEEGFDKQTQDLLHAERERYMQALTKAVNSGDKNAIKDATFKIQSAYEKIIKDAMKAAYEYGKNNAAKEISKLAPANARDVLNQIDIQANAIAESHIAELSTSAKQAIVESLNKGDSNAQALAAADQILEDSIDALTTDTSRIVMAGYVNTGRSTVFDTYADQIYALQRSELMDSSTCNYCLSIDGRVVTKDDPFAQNTIFHSNCRGIWVSILMDEQDLPPIGGIPKSIRDRFGDSVNDLLQPKNPITPTNSAGRKEAERRMKRKAK